MGKYKEIYEELSKEFIRHGISGQYFSMLEKLYAAACNTEQALKVAHEWMKDYDNIKNKYEPEVLQESKEVGNDESV